MNLIVFEAGELSGENELVLAGERAEHLAKVKKVIEGSELKVGLINGPLGTGRVAAVSKREVRLQITLDGAMPALPSTQVVLALPRPQMLKRIFEIAAAWGLERLVLVGTEKVEKSFFSSPLLRPEQIRRHLRLGLEQGMLTRLPEVVIYAKLHLLLDKEDHALAGPRCALLADPAAKTHIACSPIARRLTSVHPVTLAVGPEGGFTRHEVTAFEQRGFESVSLGASILRVEHAVCAALGQLELLRAIADEKER